MRKFLMTVVVSVSALSGCSVISKVASPALAQGEQGAAARDGETASALTGDVLYDVVLAEIAAKRGHLQVAIDLYQRLADRFQDAQLAERATRIAYFARDNKKALKAAQSWVRFDPDNMEARQIVTTLLIQEGRQDDALVHLEKILAQSARNAENGFMVIAGLLSRERDKRAALVIMAKLVARHNDDADALFAYSHLALRLGELTTAREAIDKVLDLKPDWTAATVQKARILRSQDKIPLALSFLKEAVARNPESIELRLLYARMLTDQERLGEAYEQFKYIVKARPDNDDALFATGFIALQLERYQEAEKYLTELKSRGTRGFEVNYYLGRLEELKGNDETATRWYSSISSGEYYINAQIRIAVIMARGGDLLSARGHLNALKVQRPAQALRLYLVEGELLHDAEMYEEAKSVYDQALKEIPDNADLLYARAMVAEKLDQLDVLEADLRAILERDPNNAEALNALGYTLADRTDRLEEARELISRALELRPQDYYIIDSMGWVYYRLGNHDEAIKYLRRALDMKLDPEIAAHLGEVLWVTGKKEEARQVWQRALSLGERKTEIVREVMKKFTQSD